MRLKYAFIKQRAGNYSIRRLCLTLKVHPSGYYAWLSEPQSARAKDDQRLLGLIKHSWLESGGVYGYRKIHDDLACGEALGLDLLAHPELLEEPQHAAMSAGWFWHRASLNTLADKSDFLLITKRINGGTNGLKDREEIYQRALKVLP